MKDKIVTPAQAVAIIRSGDTVSVSGFVGIGTPDELLIALEQRFLESREPAGLSVVFAAAPGGLRHWARSSASITNCSSPRRPAG